MDLVKGVIGAVDSWARWSMSSIYPRCAVNDNARFFHRSRALDAFGFYKGSSCTGIVRLAGLSGAAAIALAAYGAHVVLEDKDVNDRRKRSLENGNKQHFIHTIGLLMSHKAKYPMLTAALFSAGIICFCGPCYWHAIYNDERYKQITPAGGILFILGWLSFVF